MSRVDEARLSSWNIDLEKRAAAVRSVRSKLEDKKAACIQLEASLVELANENDASERLLVQKEHYIASRKAAFEESNTQRSAQRSLLDGEKRKNTIDIERTENALDNDWRSLEEEEKAAELGHHQRMNRIQQQLDEFERQENEMVEKIRHVRNSELGVTSLLRQLKQKEDQLRSLSEATLQQMRAELQERMPFLATAGSNHHAQLGRDGDSSFFEVLDIEDDFVQVCSGAHYTLALTKSGSVYGWGRNESGQLALPEPIVKRPTLITASFNSRVVKVSCGESHSLFLTSSGEIYGCGDGSCGQRGDGTFHSQCYTPSPVLLNESARDVFCGARTSFAITDDGDLFGWGETTTGMLGAKASPMPTLSVPTRLLVGPPRTYISTLVVSINFAILVTSRGEILGAGNNRDGQLGIADSCTYTWRPIRDVGRVSLVACGSRHTICYQVEKNRCIVLSDQLGSFTLSEPTGLAAGEDNVFAWTEGGRSLLVYGYNRNGQLGVGNIPYVEKLTHVTLPIKANVVMVSCGRKHTCLLLSGEEVHRGNLMVFMEDSCTPEGAFSKKSNTACDCKPSSLIWTYTATSVAALIVGALVARICFSQR